MKAAGIIDFQQLPGSIHNLYPLVPGRDIRDLERELKMFRQITASRSGRKGNTKMRHKATIRARGRDDAILQSASERFRGPIRTGGYLWSCWQPITFPEPENIGSGCIPRRCTQRASNYKSDDNPVSVFFLWLRFSSPSHLLSLSLIYLSIYLSLSLFLSHGVGERLLVADCEGF